MLSACEPRLGLLHHTIGDGGYQCPLPRRIFKDAAIKPKEGANVDEEEGDEVLLDRKVRCGRAFPPHVVGWHCMSDHPPSLHDYGPQPPPPPPSSSRLAQVPFDLCPKRLAALQSVPHLVRELGEPLQDVLSFFQGVMATDLPRLMGMTSGLLGEDVTQWHKVGPVGVLYCRGQAKGWL